MIFIVKLNCYDTRREFVSRDGDTAFPIPSSLNTKTNRSEAAESTARRS